MKENTTTAISKIQLVETGKSRRLSVIRNKIQEQSTQIASQTRQFSVQLKPEKKEVLLQAICLIEQRLSEILKVYPMGKKNTFFKIKYGCKVEGIKKMSMKQSFILLHLKPSSIPNFKLIEQLNFIGKTVEA